jgi:uncharacterized protein YjiS (DUF1127 family)
METDMRTFTPVLPISAAAFGRALAAFATAFTQQVKAVIRALRNRRQANALANLDPRMLKDIGISRADLNDAFSSPLWEDPTSLLRERAIERRMNRGLRTSSADRAKPDDASQSVKLAPWRQAV